MEGDRERLGGERLGAYGYVKPRLRVWGRGTHGAEITYVKKCIIGVGSLCPCREGLDGVGPDQGQNSSWHAAMCCEKQLRARSLWRDNICEAVTSPELLWRSETERLRGQLQLCTDSRLTLPCWDSFCAA